MPLHYLRKDGNRVLGIWKVTETEDWFKQQLDAPWIAEELEHYSASVRRMEYLAVRMLLKELTGFVCRVKHLPSGKPFLENVAVSVSISHTKGYAAVLLDEAGANPGIDIEYYADRVCKIASRFMHPEEWKGSAGPEDVKWLLLHWSAKETIYKRLGVDEVDFCQHLRLLPFVLFEEGSLQACEFRTPENRHFDIHYLFENDFVLTWSV